jgi:hypothetical protein
MDLAAWSRELDEERTRLQQASERRAARRGYLVFAIDPDRAADEPGYRAVFASEANTPGEATPRSARWRLTVGCGPTSRPAPTATSWPTPAGSRRAPARGKLPAPAPNACGAQHPRRP